MTEAPMPELSRPELPLPQLSQWRTFYGSMLIGIMMVVVLALCPRDMRAGVAPAVIGGLGAIALGLAAKSYGEHKANADAAAKAAPPANTILAEKG